MISDYRGRDRKITTYGFPDIVNGSFRYELLETVDGMMSSENKLSNTASPIKNYYVGWSLSTIDADGNIDDTSTITAYDSGSKSVTLSPAISGTTSETKYKLYFNSENSVFGNSGGKNIYTGSRNIAIGSHAGPTNSNNSISDKLYIDSNTKSRGSDSFIYGNMTRGSEELKVNADLTVLGDITGTEGKTSTLQRVVIGGNTTGSINNTTIGATSHTTGKFTDVIITGDLDVRGTTTTIDTESLIIEDPLLLLAKNNNSADNMDIGFYGMYNDGTTTRYSGIFRDTDDEKWKIFKELTTS